MVDQFLMEMESHELSGQVDAHGHRRMENVLWVARSLEAVPEEERHASRSCKPVTQTRFVTSGPPDTTEKERVVQEVLDQMGHDPQRNRGGRRRKRTPKTKASLKCGEKRSQTHFLHSISRQQAWMVSLH